MEHYSYTLTLTGWQANLVLGVIVIAGVAGAAAIAMAIFSGFKK